MPDRSNKRGGYNINKSGTLRITILYLNVYNNYLNYIR